ncbi:hypothetical protein GCM10011609_87140 [Lentzea pudingi]|uniref:Anti-sigma regulatory factor (Ser/Thr protein kinase) n=1 Tax=Lentzea pudingi TaxID=1789439 RepID=A0ABQ2IUQ7_9PSEU|nr:hypothetical protein GCM10011609_87140 [Lentzea pudingi]
MVAPPDELSDSEEVKLVRLTSQLDDGPKSAMLKLDSPAVTAAAIRHWTRNVLSGVTGDDLDDILLIFNEIVSNVFDHGRNPS